MTVSDGAVAIHSISTHHLSAPLNQPRRNAFGVMRTRPALLVSVTLDDGAVGWGEVFANWPVFGAHHRARIISELLAPLTCKHHFESPHDLYLSLEQSTAALAIQCGEPGPFAQCIAGIEIAVTDAVARRAGLPLWRWLNGHHKAVSDRRPTRVYASGLTSDSIEQIVPFLRDSGWTAFKLKVGFGERQDRQTLERLFALAGPAVDIMVDANQKWSLENALYHIAWLQDYPLLWVEEPIRADSPHADWQELCAASRIPIAAGENLRGQAAFAAAVAAGVAVVQPDPIKWGGLSGSRSILQGLKNGVSFAPHCLCSGVGIAATISLAIAEQAAFMEVDVSENALRTDLWDLRTRVHEGALVVPTEDGIGLHPNPEFLETWRMADS
ncbi:MAG: mandelate racemase/muconate lactonizing enzyme family protein [Pseudomonadota bacterium]